MVYFVYQKLTVTELRNPAAEIKREASGNCKRFTLCCRFPPNGWTLQHLIEALDKPEVTQHVKHRFQEGNELLPVT
jgi:hypothetical protein